MRHHVNAAVFLMAGMLPLAGAAPAIAQSPSADQIIRSLRPTAPTGVGRGIRPVGPAADAPASVAAPGAAPGATTGQGAPRTPQPAQAVARPAAPSVNLTVNFASGSAVLAPDALRTLDELGRALTSAALSGYRFRIEGHTDTVGTPESNKALSERRASAVVEYLATKWSVDRAKVAAVGMGQEQLQVPTGANMPQARNRRVTVVNTGA